MHSSDPSSKRVDSINGDVESHHRQHPTQKNTAEEHRIRLDWEKDKTVDMANTRNNEARSSSCGPAALCAADPLGKHRLIVPWWLAAVPQKFVKSCLLSLASVRVIRS